MTRHLGVVLAAAAVLALPAAASSVPTHRYLVTAYRLTGQRPVVAILSPAGRIQRVVTRPARFLPDQAAWSPDGSTLAWNAHAGIFVERADGSGLRLLVRKPTSCTRDCYPLTFAWSPDGTKLLVGGAGGLTTRLITVDVASGAVRSVFTPKPYVSYLVAGWSPDGKQIAVARASGDATTSCCSLELVVANADGKNPRTLFKAAEATHDFPWASWSPDGRSLAVVTDGRDPRDPRLAVLDVATGAMRVLKGLNPYDEPVSWSPDSQRLAVASFDRPVATISVADGTIHSLGVRAHTAVWEPTGDLILVRGTASRQVLQSVDGVQQPKLLFTMPQGLSIFTIDPH